MVKNLNILSKLTYIFKIKYHIPLSGGFLSVYTLANDARSTFGCAVAISPVSSWQTLGNA
jgi:hypothetical protein